jgi:hypothetical protein
VFYTRTIDGVPSGEVVGAVEDDVGFADKVVEIGCAEALLQRNHVYFRVDCVQSRRAASTFTAPTDSVR